MESAIRSGNQIHEVADHFDTAFSSLWAHWHNHVRHSAPPENQPATSPLDVPGGLLEMERIVAEALDFLAPWALTPASLRILERRERQIALRSRLALHEKSAAPKLDLATYREWQDLKARILLTLERFPDAYQAMVDALADPPNDE
jgi:hypothetical protein